jgi:hypothetical protein
MVGAVHDGASQDRDAELVVAVLRVLHGAWEAVALDDGPLRCATGLKLGLLLEGGAEQVGRGDSSVLSR